MPWIIKRRQHRRCHRINCISSNKDIVEWSRHDSVYKQVASLEVMPCSGLVQWLESEQPNQADEEAEGRCIHLDDVNAIQLFPPELKFLCCHSHYRELTLSGPSSAVILFAHRTCNFISLPPHHSSTGFPCLCTQIPCPALTFISATFPRAFCNRVLEMCFGVPLSVLRVKNSSKRKPKPKRDYVVVPPKLQQDVSALFHTEKQTQKPAFALSALFAGLAIRRCRPS